MTLDSEWIIYSKHYLVLCAELYRAFENIFQNHQIAWFLKLKLIWFFICVEISVEWRKITLYRWKQSFSILLYILFDLMFLLIFMNPCASSFYLLIIFHQRLKFVLIYFQVRQWNRWTNLVKMKNYKLTFHNHVQYVCTDQSIAFLHLWAHDCCPNCLSIALEDLAKAAEDWANVPKRGKICPTWVKIFFILCCTILLQYGLSRFCVFILERNRFKFSNTFYLPDSLIFSSSFLLGPPKIRLSNGTTTQNGSDGINCRFVEFYSYDKVVLYFWAAVFTSVGWRTGTWGTVIKILKMVCPYLFVFNFFKLVHWWRLGETI